MYRMSFESAHISTLSPLPTTPRAVLARCTVLPLLLLVLLLPPPLMQLDA